MSDYLWDRSGPEDPDVSALEAELGPLAFNPAAHPLPQPARTRRKPRVYAALAVAAAVTIAAGLYGFHRWRLTWTPDAAWTVNHIPQSLAVGDTMHVETGVNRLEVAHLGVIAAEPGTTLQLLATGTDRHRLRMTSGEINARLWAPPGRVQVQTPAGAVIDLGCIFRLSVNGEGTALLHVDTGWVNMDNSYGQQFVPAGATAVMRIGHAPTVPVYDDASAAFREAVAAIEADPLSPPPGAMKAVTFEARTRDVFTLLVLSDVDHLETLTRTVILERASVLQPPPSSNSIARIVGGDRDEFWKWYDSLPLPSLKNWWANWRDVFPR